MSIRLVRQMSDTPNITNKDDIKMVRYAYGGYNGVVKGVGNELNSVAPSTNGLFKISSGRIVLQGWEIDIDEAGWELPKENVSETRYYSIYLNLSVETETARIMSVYDSTGYPEIDLGEDLNVVPNGVANLELFRFETQGNTIINVLKVVSTINYVKDVVEQFVGGDKTVKRSDKTNGLVWYDLEFDKDNNPIRDENGKLIYHLGDGSHYIKALRISNGGQTRLVLQAPPNETGIKDGVHDQVSVWHSDNADKAVNADYATTAGHAGSSSVSSRAVDYDGYYRVGTMESPTPTFDLLATQGFDVNSRYIVFATIHIVENDGKIIPHSAQFILDSKNYSQFTVVCGITTKDTTSGALSYVKFLTLKLEASTKYQQGGIILGKTVTISELKSKGIDSYSINDISWLKVGG